MSPYRRPGEFDNLGLNPWRFSYSGDLYYQPVGMSLATLPIGYGANFLNDPAYLDYSRPTVMWNNEAVIKTGNNAFVGWGIPPVAAPKAQTEAQIKQELVIGFNKDLDWWQKGTSLKNIPGYTGTAWFINIPKVAMMIFNLRTKQSN